MERLIEEMNDSKIFNVLITKENIFEYYDVYNSYLNCKNCKGLNECKNNSKGYKATLNGLKKCDYKKEYDIFMKRESNIESLFFSKKLSESRFDDYEVTNQTRSDLLKGFTHIINNNINKGMFVSGTNNAGKTFFISCVANEYKNRGKKVLLTFVPDLIRYLRSIRFNEEIEKRIDELKNVDVLMLDDLGVELFDPWFAFEILTPVLNYRLQEGKITYFTSNYSIKEMVRQCPDKQSKDYLRLIRRIESLCLKCDNDNMDFSMKR